MNLTNLDTSLKAINDNFSLVNHGGCACVAAMLAKALRHTFPIMRITSSDAWGDSNNNIDEIRQVMSNNLDKNEWYENGIEFGHVWVEIYIDGNWYALDSTGVSTAKELHRKCGIPAEGSFSIEEVQALADTETWNPSFDRNQLPAIQELISETIH